MVVVNVLAARRPGAGRSGLTGWLARAQGNDTIGASGLRPGEKVFTDGHACLVPGAKVEIRGPGGGRGGWEARPRGTFSVRPLSLDIGLSIPG